MEFRGKDQLRWLFFKGTLDSNKFQQLALQFLVLFIRSNFPEHHRFHMNNTPIELVWHDLKRYLSEVVKPDNSEELMNGIEEFLKDIEGLYREFERF